VREIIMEQRAWYCVPSLRQSICADVYMWGKTQCSNAARQLVPTVAVHSTTHVSKALGEDGSCKVAGL
jgi:hypothetical protein